MFRIQIVFIDRFSFGNVALAAGVEILATAFVTLSSFEWFLVTGRGLLK